MKSKLIPLIKCKLSTKSHPNIFLIISYGLDTCLRNNISLKSGMIVLTNRNVISTKFHSAVTLIPLCCDHHQRKNLIFDWVLYRQCNQAIVRRSLSKGRNIIQPFCGSVHLSTTSIRIQCAQYVSRDMHVVTAWWPALLPLKRD